MEGKLAGKELIAKLIAILDEKQKEQSNCCKNKVQLGRILKYIKILRKVSEEVSEQNEDELYFLNYLVGRLTDDYFAAYLALRFSHYNSALSLTRAIYEKQFVIIYLAQNPDKFKRLNKVIKEQNWKEFDKIISRVFEDAKDNWLMFPGEKEKYRYLSNAVTHPHDFHKIFHIIYDEGLESIILQIWFSYLSIVVDSFENLAIGKLSANNLEELRTLRILDKKMDQTNLTNSELEYPIFAQELDYHKTALNKDDVNEVLIIGYFIEILVMKIAETTVPENRYRLSVSAFLLLRVAEYLQSSYVFLTHLCYSQTICLVRNIYEIYLVFVGLEGLSDEHCKDLSLLVQKRLNNDETDNELINCMDDLRKKGKKIVEKEDAELAAYYSQLSNHFSHPKTLAAEFSFKYESEKEIYAFIPLISLSKKIIMSFYKRNEDLLQDAKFQELLIQLIPSTFSK